MDDIQFERLLLRVMRHEKWNRSPRDLECALDITEREPLEHRVIGYGHVIRGEIGTTIRWITFQRADYLLEQDIQGAYQSAKGLISEQAWEGLSEIRREVLVELSFMRRARCLKQTAYGTQVVSVKHREFLQALENDDFALATRLMLAYMPLDPRAVHLRSLMLNGGESEPEQSGHRWRMIATIVFGVALMALELYEYLEAGLPPDYQPWLLGFVVIAALVMICWQILS